MAKKQNFIHGAAILTVGVIIMKLLGFIYKIPLGNILGDEGYSMFTSAYSIYFIFFTLATAGLPVALSRLIAEADANGRAKQEEKTFRVALATFAVIGVIFALILFLFPEWLADKYLENPDAAPGILQGHFGLAGIQERTQQLNGGMEITSAPGKGTKIRVVVSIAEKDEV